MKCHMAVHTVENNKAEKRAKQCVVCAGRLAIMQRVIGGSLIGYWKKVRKQAIQILESVFPEGGIGDGGGGGECGGLMMRK